VRKKCPAKDFEPYLLFRPFWMFLTNAALCELACEQAHVEREEKTSFAAHRAQNPDLPGISFPTGITTPHGRILRRYDGNYESSVREDILQN
jgi:hypothetical protein